MKKIVIADHHPVTRKGITCMLKKDENFKIVGKAITVLNYTKL